MGLFERISSKFNSRRNSRSSGHDEFVKTRIDNSDAPTQFDPQTPRGKELGMLDGIGSPHFGKTVYTLLNKIDPSGTKETIPDIFDSRATEVYERLRNTQRLIGSPDISEQEKKRYEVTIATLNLMLKEMESEGSVPITETTTDAELDRTYKLLSSYKADRLKNGNEFYYKERVEKTITRIKKEVEGRVRNEEITRLKAEIPNLTGDEKVSAHTRLLELLSEEGGFGSHPSEFGALNPLAEADTVTEPEDHPKH